MDSDCYIALNWAMAFLPSLNYAGTSISVICPSYFSFYNLFKTALCLTHWSCSWLGDFVNLHWLCVKQGCERLQPLSKVSSWVLFIVVFIPCHTLAYLKLCSSLYYFILRSSFHWGTMQFQWDWSVSIVRLKKALKPTLYSLPSKFMHARPKGSIHVQ